LRKYLSSVKNKLLLKVLYTSIVSLSDGQDGVIQPHKRLDAGWNADSSPDNHIPQTVLGSTCLLQNGYLGLSGAVTKLPEREADSLECEGISSLAHGRLHGAELSNSGKAVLVPDNYVFRYNDYAMNTYGRMEVWLHHS
jgi:hypothetical protein